mgnify:CR=1 FL=1
MKRLLSISLVIIFLFNIFGYYLTFQIIEAGYKKNFRLQILNNITSDNIEILVIPDNEMHSKHTPFRWMESDEFKYYGKMYDVIKHEKQGTNNIFYCINDKNEEQLFVRFEDFIKHGETSNLPYQQKSRSIISTIIKDAVNNPQKLGSFPQKKFDYKFYYFFSVQTAVVSEIYVPPKA